MSGNQSDFSDERGNGKPTKIVDRRTVLRALAAATAALSVGACGGNEDGLVDAGAVQKTGVADGTSNRAPIWKTVPTIAFVQGAPSSISISDFVTDPDGDAVTISKNAVSLPPGVTYDAPRKRFIYDGVGAATSTSGHVLMAEDGRA